MNYQVRKLEGQGYFNVYVANNGQNEFRYWTKNTTYNVNQAVVVFNNRNANIQLKDGMAVLSLRGITNFWELQNAISFFMNNISNGQSINIKLHFIVENENQRQVAEALGYNLRVNYEVVKANSYVDDNVNKVEDRLKDGANNIASGSKTIEVQNGNKITVSDNKAYVNSGTLSIEEQKYALLKEWKMDPFMSVRIRDLDEQALDRLLMENVTSNLKNYRMEAAREQVAMDKVGEVAMNKAVGEDGLVNAELGIVENNVSNVNQYSSVEQRGENVQVVNPNVTSSQVNSGGVSGSSMSGDGSSSEYIEPNMVENEEQSREALNEFYVDEEYNVYDKDGNVIGKIGQEGLVIDYNNNILMKNGQLMGYIGDYNDIGKNNTNNKSKPNVRVLKKKDENKSAAFVSLPVIMFVLSAMLLIASVVLLFVLD